MNFSTLMVLSILIGVVTLIIKRMIKNKQSRCGGACCDCSSSRLCHSSSHLYEYYQRQKG